MRAIPLMLLAAACATSRGSEGTIVLHSFTNQAAGPIRYSVGKGSITGRDLVATVQGDCISGSVGRTPINFCKDPANPNHWSGTGEFVAVKDPDGHHVNVDGYMLLDTRRQASMTQLIPLGEGPQWDELARNPALLAIAATAADLQAGRIRR
jgi:hypothetical protein